jgi:hypothetical protein
VDRPVRNVEVSGKLSFRQMWRAANFGGQRSRYIEKKTEADFISLFIFGFISHIVSYVTELIWIKINELK